MALTTTFNGSAQSFSHTAPLSDSVGSHIEAARQQAHAACLSQAYQLIKGITSYQVDVGETLVLPVTNKGPKGGTTAGRITRTLTVTPQ